MNLRQAKWRRLLGLHLTSKLPKMHDRFNHSTHWQSQQNVLDNDLARMPQLRHDTVTKIVQRYSATLPYAGYTQGNLYIVYCIGLVFGDEPSVFWAFARMLHRLHAYGPTTPVGTHIFPAYILQHAESHVPIGLDMWDLIMRLRWAYIMFGQTFAHEEALLSVWDYCLQGNKHMHSLCFALLHRGIAQNYAAECHLEIASKILNQSISSLAETAELISQAQLFLQCTGRFTTSTLLLQNKIHPA